jgi:hypothetical protein
MEKQLARTPAVSAGHAALALASFALVALVERSVISQRDAHLIAGRAALWTDRDDPRAASLLDALTARLGAAHSKP